MTLERRVVMDLKSGRIHPARQTQPLLTSSRARWNGFFLEESRPGETELNDVCAVEHMVGLQMDGPATVEWRSDGQLIRKTIAPGQVSIVPAHVPWSVRARSNHSFLTVSLEMGFFACATAGIGGVDRLDLRCVLGVEDPLLREMVLSLRAEARHPTSSSELYTESLATGLATHLAHRYAVQRVKARQVEGGLARPALRRVVETVHSQIAEDLSVPRLARLVDLSPFHFSRLFKKSAGLPPHEFVTRCRVERARQLLLRSDTSISEVAVAVGFCDQSHLTRHFRRVVGVTPADYCRRVVPRKRSYG